MGFVLAMSHARSRQRPPARAELVDFDAALFATLPARLKAELLQEAQLLIGAFGGPDAESLDALAGELSAGGRDLDMDRAHARRLAATLKHLARSGAAA